MFTGLIADKARVISISRGAESAVIEIESVLIPEIKTGDSVSINGTCLTAIELNGDSFKADVMIQTLKVTSLGKLSEGDFVNLELATGQIQDLVDTLFKDMSMELEALLRTHQVRSGTNL